MFITDKMYIYSTDQVEYYQMIILTLENAPQVSANILTCNVTQQIISALWGKNH